MSDMRRDFDRVALEFPSASALRPEFVFVAIFVQTTCDRAGFLVSLLCRLFLRRDVHAESDEQRNNSDHFDFHSAPCWQVGEHTRLADVLVLAIAAMPLRHADI